MEETQKIKPLWGIVLVLNVFESPGIPWISMTIKGSTSYKSKQCDQSDQNINTFIHNRKRNNACRSSPVIAHCNHFLQSLQSVLTINHDHKHNQYHQNAKQLSLTISYR